MAFEADCEASTVLEALLVPSTSRFLVPGEFRTSCHLWPAERRNLAVGGSFRQGSSCLNIPILRGSIVRECPH